MQPLDWTSQQPTEAYQVGYEARDVLTRQWLIDVNTIDNAGPESKRKLPQVV